MDSLKQSLISETKSPFKKAAEKLVNSVIEKTENSNFQNTELENLLKIATAVAKTVPDLLNLAGGENSELAEGKSIFLAYIRQNIINDKRAMKSAKSLLKYCAEHQTIE
ncbi:MAG: hypothetical protein WCR42_14200 [bacterium]